jgi:hypothetical protein
MTKSGSILEGLDIVGSVRIDADNVTIRRSRVTSDAPWAILIGASVTGTLIEDVEINGGPGCEAGIGIHDYVARRVNIHGCVDGAKAETNSTIESSWIHDLRAESDSHNDCVQVSAGSHITLRDNFLAVPHRLVSTILIGPDLGPISDVLIEGNWLDGGNFTLYLDGSSIVVRKNRFGRSYVYGLASVKGNITQDGNVFDDTGESVTL